MTENRTNPVVARAVEHFQGIERFEAVVPEWGEDGVPLMLYATVLTMAERRKIQRMNADDNYGATCDIIITKAEDADGKRVFSKADKPAFLNRIDPEVISRVAKDLTGGEDPTGDLREEVDVAGKD